MVCFSAVEERDKINQGIKILEESTCINFIKGRGDTHSINVQFLQEA